MPLLAPFMQETNRNEKALFSSKLRRIRFNLHNSSHCLPLQLEMANLILGRHIGVGEGVSVPRNSRYVSVRQQHSQGLNPSPKTVKLPQNIRTSCVHAKYINHRTNRRYCPVPPSLRRWIHPIYKGKHTTSRHFPRA